MGSWLVIAIQILQYLSFGDQHRQVAISMKAIHHGQGVAHRLCLRAADDSERLAHRRSHRYRYRPDRVDRSGTRFP